MKVVFDIGGTKTRVAAVTKDGLGSVIRKPTAEVLSDELENLLSLMHEVAGGETIDAAIGGLPGTLTLDGKILFMPHFPQWNGFAFAEELSKRLNASARIEHDANLGALGEYIYGAGKGAKRLAYLALGTGLGIGNIVDGEIMSPSVGFEAGHQIVDYEKRVGIDETIGGRALKMKYGKRAEDLPREVYAALTPLFAAGIFNTALHWLPDVVVLGGSLMNEENGFRLAEIENAVRELPPLLAKFPEIKKATLGDDANLWGAVALA
jgi:predicted NBD/HSP70 family sugar kinase